MEIFIPLMVAAIQSAGQVLSSLASKAKETASNYVFDKEFFEDTIVESSEQLANLINVAALNLEVEMREQSILDVIQDLQAHVATLGDLLGLAKTSEITPALAQQLISGGLIPLNKSLKKAEIRLTQHERDDMRLFCHVVGINTLISGYIYLGQSVPTLQKDLEDSIYIFQKRLLDSIAQSKHQIPWNKVPHLLTTDGISELVELYDSTLQDAKKSSSVNSSSTALENADSKPNSSPTVKKRKVRDMKLQEVTGTASKYPILFSKDLYCSKCGWSTGINKNTLVCPSCKRKFV